MIEWRFNILQIITTRLRTLLRSCSAVQVDGARLLERRVVLDGPRCADLLLGLISKLDTRST